MPTLDLSLASGDILSVRRFAVHEGVSSLFTVSVWARSPDPSLDLEGIIGNPAGLHIASGYAYAALGGTRLWTGLCNHVEQVQAEETGLSTYRFRIVPRLWLLTQRRGNRIYQHLSIPDILQKLLGEWGIAPLWSINRSLYPLLEYKVQYAESDYVFFSRLLEEAGLAYTFIEDEKAGSELVIGDHLHGAEMRSAPPIPYHDNPTQAAEREYLTRIRLSHEVRPGAYTIRDHDFRNPEAALFVEAPKDPAPEDRYEQYHYQPGATLAETAKGGATPIADDLGTARYLPKYGQDQATHALLGVRQGRVAVSFETNVIDLRPGTIFCISGHTHVELDQARSLLTTQLTIEGDHQEEWSTTGHAVFADVAYRPALATPKPEVLGVQSAVVVGPGGQEIHVDEIGRVRVQFPWDREGTHDEHSSCWIRVNQGWGGKGYGMLMLPRIGQEVLIGFLNGDPDQPILVGRLFNQTNPVPYRLPENKTISTWKSDSSQGSNGFNEIKFEDKKTDELVYEQSEKNRRAYVKHDETITVGHDRDKHVGVNETDTTGANRTEITGINRTELTDGSRFHAIGGNKGKLVKGNEIERTEGNRLLRVGKNVDAVIKKNKRERVELDVHQHVKGNRKERIDGDQSLTIWKNQHEHVLGSSAMETGSDLHLRSAEIFMGEAAADVTIKGPGGFIRIDASGITIKGTMVKINVGGSAGNGKGAHPLDPLVAKESVISEHEEADTGVTVETLPAREGKPRTAAKKAAPKPAEAPKEAKQAAEICELERLEIECSHEKHKGVIKLPAAKGAKKPFDLLEVIAAGEGDGDKIKYKVEMAKPRCGTTHKGQALVIRSGAGRWVKAEDASTFEVTTHDIHIQTEFYRYIWPWNMPPVDYSFMAPACHHGGLTATVRAYPALEASVDILIALSADKIEARVGEKIEKAQGAGRVEKRGRPAQTDWAFEIKGKVKYGTQSVELGAKFESKIKQWASFNLLVKRAIDKFCELFYRFTGVIVIPQLPNLSLSYGGKFKEIDASYRVGAEWQITLKADPLIGLTFKLDIIDVMIAALEKTQFAVIARFLKKVKDWAKDKGQTIEVTLSFGGTIGGEVGAKKNAAEKNAGPYGSIEGKLKVEFGAKASFGATHVVGFAFGAEAKANTGLSAKLALDNNATGVFVKGTFGLIACKFEYSAFASGKFIWELKETRAGEYTFWEDTDLLASDEKYLVRNVP